MALDGYVRVARYAGLDDAGRLVDALATLEGDPSAVADELRRHHLIGLVRARVPDAQLRARLPPGLVDALTSRRPVGRVPPVELVRTYGEVRRVLDRRGVEVLAFKGFVLAERLYGGMDRRPQHDLDVLVRARDFRTTLGALRALGFRRRHRDLHSIALRRGDVQVDVHRHLRWAPAFAVDDTALWQTAVERTIGGIAVRTLSDEYALVALVLAAFEDLGQGAAKLKQLLDLDLLLRAMEPAADWEAFFGRRDAEHLLGIAVNVLALVTELFESTEALPRLSAALARRRELRVLGTRDDEMRLLAAPAKDHANLVWFGRVYPGSLAHYLFWFWWFGLPENLVRFGPRWLRAQAAVLRDAARARCG
jgi:hypothetical protein